MQKTAQLPSPPRTREGEWEGRAARTAGGGEVTHPLLKPRKSLSARIQRESRLRGQGGENGQGEETKRDAELKVSAGGPEGSAAAGRHAWQGSRLCSGRWQKARRGMRRRDKRPTEPTWGPHTISRAPPDTALGTRNTECTQRCLSARAPSSAPPAHGRR